MRLFIALVLMAGIAATTTAKAEDLVHPSPGLSPEDVVRTQLEALQVNDQPARNSGIRQVWEFAHPVNRRMTGPIENFTTMMKGPFYNALINHSAHTIIPVEQTANAAAFDVEITGASGLVLKYRWVVERAFGEGLDGSWMTVSVSIATMQGRAI